MDRWMASHSVNNPLAIISMEKKIEWSSSVKDPNFMQVLTHGEQRRFTLTSRPNAAKAALKNSTLIFSKIKDQ